jgi:hypothetical protein
MLNRPPGEHDAVVLEQNCMRLTEGFGKFGSARRGIDVTRFKRHKIFRFRHAMCEWTSIVMKEGRTFRPGLACDRAAVGPKRFQTSLIPRLLRSWENGGRRDRLAVLANCVDF